MPHLTALADFRDKVRKEAINIKATNILTECDNLRNNVLPELGVRLEDKENEATVIKLVDKNELLREREEKKLLEEKKNAEKEQKKAEAAAKQAELDAKRKMPPSEIFKGQNYSKFDDKVYLLYPLDISSRGCWLLYPAQDPTASANLDGRALKNEPIGVVAEGLGVHYVVSVKSVKFLPTT
jgi:hypothetical protein